MTPIQFENQTAIQDLYGDFMKPIVFNEQTHILTKDQKQYIPLPIHYDNTHGRGKTTSCWKLTWKERFKILFSGIVWCSQLTFGKQYQPMHLTVTKPIQNI